MSDLLEPSERKISEPPICTTQFTNKPPCGLPMVMVGKSVENFVWACVQCDQLPSSNGNVMYGAPWVGEVK